MYRKLASLEEMSHCLKDPRCGQTLNKAGGIASRARSKDNMRKFLPVGLKEVLPYTIGIASELITTWRVGWLKWRSRRKKPGSLVRFLGYRVRINDGPSFFIQHKDIFTNRIYHFQARRADPRILDCGSNIGMSVLYFKHTYPQARVVAFEPDPEIFPYLQENIESNRLANVQLTQAAVAGHQGTTTLCSDGRYGSYLAECVADTRRGWVKYEVPCVRLRDYLTEPVDFLKMNIEGAEWEVLTDSEDCLRKVQEIVIEYHHMPGLPRTLHKILDLLHRQRFEYLINDFDSETNNEVRPPFRLTPESRYFLLIYAKRMD
jgi:FkbM family methyltransferase